MRQTVSLSIIMLLLCLCPLFAQEWDEVLEGEGISVIGREESTQQVRVISRAEIERAHAPDITSLLEEVLNMGITSYGPYGNAASVNIRGLGAGRVAVLIDGVPVNSPQSGSFGFESIDINTIERIEVVYGGSDPRFNVSGAMGGLINIITVKKQRRGLRFGGGVSNTSAMPGAYQQRDGSRGEAEPLDLVDTQNINAFVSNGWEALSLSAHLFANRAANHFLFDDYYGERRRRVNNEVLDIGGGLSLTWQLDDLTRLSYSGDLYRADKNISGPMTAVEGGVQKDFSTRHRFSFDKALTFRDGVEAALTYSMQTLRYEDSAVSLHRIHTLSLMNGWSWDAAPSLTLKAGWDYAYHYLDSSNIGVKDGHNGGVYLSGAWGGARPFLITPSVKLVFDASLVPIPKLGLAWFVSDTLTLKNNYFRAFKFPTFNDRYWSGDASGNPNLRAEDGWGGDIVLAYEGIFDLEATLHASYIRDSIHWRSVSSVWQPVNIGEAALFGASFRLSFTLPLHTRFIETVGASFSYQYLLSFVLTEGFASGIRMPYMPEHTAGLALDIRWRSGSLLLSAHYEGVRYTETLNIVTLRPFLLLNATVNQRISPPLTVFAVFRNLLNTSYVSVQDYPMPGFTMMVGMNVRYGD